jgi:hypothetical protein
MTDVPFCQGRARSSEDDGFAGISRHLLFSGAGTVTVTGTGSA